MSANPNPQSIAFAAWESPTITVTMDTNGSITGQHFTLSIRDQYGVLKLQSSTFTIVDAGSVSTPGKFSFTIASALAGALLNDYQYDIWRTDAGSEKQLCCGPCLVRREQWK